MISFREDPLYRENDRVTIESIVQRDEYRLRTLSYRFPDIHVIVDVGAHIGSFTTAARNQWPTANILAIEPNIYAYSQLVQNVRDKVGIYPLLGAIGYTQTRGFIKENQGNPLVSLVIGADTPNPFECDFPGTYRTIDYEIPVLRLEEALDLVNYPGIDLLKLDCEGAEFDIVKGISSVLASTVKLVVGEHHTSGGYPALKPLLEEKFPHLSFFSEAHLFFGVPNGNTAS